MIKKSTAKVLVYTVPKNTELEIYLDTIIKGKAIAKALPINGSIKIYPKKIQYKPKDSFTGADILSIINSENQEILIVVNVENTVFKPRARLLIQLGNQLIKNESIALVELVKNSYDADASYCKVYMQNVDKKLSGQIIIEDDGLGMDLSTITNSWLEPGSDLKEKIVNNISYSKKGRLPIGEKGIGRFGVHKLGKEIELISRKAGKKEVVVEINWEEFEKYKYLDQAPVTLFERSPEFFTENKTGTRIIIKNLSKNWNKGMLRDVFRAINAISTPTSYNIDELIKISEKKKSVNEKNDLSKFDAQIITNHTEWIKDIPTWKEIIEYALFFFEIEIKEDVITKFKYKFQPWQNMHGIRARTVTERNNPIAKLLDIMDPDEAKAVALAIPKNLQIGLVQFKGCIFIRDLPVLKILGRNPNIVKEYLDENGGIRIYRNGMRVYDYGEKENDWLDLDYRRFNDPGVRISNNLMLTSINLSREKSKDLIEKTNREGFIDNEAYNVFKKQILYSLKLVELLRQEDKKKIDSQFKKKEKKHEPVLKSIENLKLLVNEKVRTPSVKKEIIVYINTIEKNYKFMNETLVKSASAGLGWSIYIHEIEKIISEISKISKIEKSSSRLLQLITHLSNLIESYAQVLRKTIKSNENLVKVIDQALFNVEFRLKAHGIGIIGNYKKYKGNSNAKIARNLIIANIMNLIDNSIYWLDRSARKEKKILIDIIENEKFISIVVADNGNGFALSPQEMVEPFVSAKPGGMGLGLHIIKEVMDSQNGNISFNEDGRYKTDRHFKNGATVILSFKK